MEPTKREKALYGIPNKEDVKKSPFRVMLETASALGHKRISFDVDTANYSEEDGSERWTVMEWTSDNDCLSYRGKSGQEALNKMIAATRAKILSDFRKTVDK